MADITFTITVPTDKKTQILNDFCAHEGYQATLEDGTANPETKAEFARKRVLNYIKQSVISYRAQKSAEEARIASIQEVEAISFT